MEKRRLLLVVMLLATSGAALAFKSKGTLKDCDGNNVRDASGVEVTWKWYNKPMKELSLKWRTRKSRKEAAKCAAQAFLIPVEVAKEASLGRILKCRPIDLVGAGIFGTSVVGLGLGIGFYLTATSEPVQEGVKKFVRGVRRTLSFRKKTEKKTDASVIAA